MCSREAPGKGLMVHRDPQRQVSETARFSSYNVLINDLSTKMSLMLMTYSGDAMLGSILNAAARNIIAEDLGDLDTSRSD